MPRARFEVYTEVKNQVEVFWVVTACSVPVGYQHFRGPCCLHLQGEVIGITTQKVSSQDASDCLSNCIIRVSNILFLFIKQCIITCIGYVALNEINMNLE
jgi:hypothetical protein